MTADFVDLYFTFGIKYESEPDPYLRAAHPDGWLRVRGHDYEEAWDAGFRLTGNQHAFDYPVERFHPERFPRGELMFCDLTSGERPPEPMPEGLVERMQEAVRCGSAVVPPSGSQVREGLQRGACGMTALLIVWAVVGTLAIALLVWGAVQLWWLP